MKILIVDDEEGIRKVIKEYCSNENYETDEASNGKEAVRLVIQNKQYNIKALLLDLKMPEYDGFMVLDYFKQNNLFNKIPVIIISGDDSKGTIEKAFTYNIVDMLNKPFSKKNILNIVEKCS